MIAMIAPGVKFKDSELVGFPIRIGIGENLGQGRGESKPRAGALIAAKAEDAIGRVRKCSVKQSDRRRSVKYLGG